MPAAPESPLRWKTRLESTRHRTGLHSLARAAGILLITLCIPLTASAASTITLRWDAASSNEDGSALTDFASHTLLVTGPDGLSTIDGIRHASYTLTLAKAGTYSLSVVTINKDGIRSAPSATLSVTVEGDSSDNDNRDDNNPDSHNPNSDEDNNSGDGTDSDGDGTPDSEDNCPQMKNGSGDQCESGWKRIYNDFNGDGATDITTVQKKRGAERAYTLHAVLTGASESSITTFDIPRGIPLPADYDGDGKTDIATLIRDSENVLSVVLERSSDKAMQTIKLGAHVGTVTTNLHIDADRQSDIVIARASGTMLLVSSKSGNQRSIPLPVAYDRIVDVFPADLVESDGIDEILLLVAGKRTKLRKLVVLDSRTGEVIRRYRAFGASRCFTADISGQGELEPVCLVRRASGKRSVVRSLTSRFKVVLPGRLQKVSPVTVRTKEGTVRDAMLAQARGKKLKLIYLPSGDVERLPIRSSRSFRLLPSVKSIITRNR